MKKYKNSFNKMFLFAFNYFILLRSMRTQSLIKDIIGFCELLKLVRQVVISIVTRRARMDIPNCVLISLKKIEI